MWRSSSFPWTYLESLYQGKKSQHLFQDIRTYVMFIGQPRSGTSLIGSLLNAHQNMCVAQELNALRYIQRGYGRNQLFWLLLARDKTFAQSGRTWTGYDYTVPGQWQGKFEKLEIIGDKKAGLSTDQLGLRPGLLEKVLRIAEVPVRIIHIVRDPYNVITTVHRRRKISLEQSADLYFRRCHTNWQLMQQHADIIKTLRLEDLIHAPQQNLQDVCSFLGTAASQSYLNDSAALLFGKPRQSKTGSNWPHSLIQAVSKRVDQFPFLAGYQYDNDKNRSQPLAA